MNLYPLLVLAILRINIDIYSEELKFNNNGSFKILQISDTHFGNGVKSKCNNYYGNCSGLDTVKFISKALNIEKPDLVVFTGDLIDKEAADAKWSLDLLLDPVIKGNYKFSAVLGDTDGESTLPREQLLSYLQKKNNSFIQFGNVYGKGNFILKVMHDDEVKTELIMLDSGRKKSDSKINYDWFQPSQLDLINKTVTKGIPKLAFFHIPIPEYSSASKKYNISGTKYEDEDTSNINGGLFSTLYNLDYVVSTHVGHDHINDYCVDNNGINLCYSGGAGYSAYGKQGWNRRMRVIQLQDFGKKVKTWKLLDKTYERVGEEYLYNNDLPNKYIKRGKDKYISGIHLTILFLSTALILCVIYIVLTLDIYCPNCLKNVKTGHHILSN